MLIDDWGRGRKESNPESLPHKGKNCRFLLWAQLSPRRHSLRPACCTEPGGIWAGVRWYQWCWSRLWSRHWGRKSLSGCTRWTGSTWGLSQNLGSCWCTESLKKQEHCFLMRTLRQLGPQRQRAEASWAKLHKKQLNSAGSGWSPPSSPLPLPSSVPSSVPSSPLSPPASPPSSYYLFSLITFLSPSISSHFPYSHSQQQCLPHLYL